MYKFLLQSLISIGFFLSVTFAQNNSNNFWSEINESQIVQSGERYIIPQSYRTLKLDFENLKDYLAEAPFENSSGTFNKLTVISLPMPNGTINRFSVFASPVMETSLAAKYPEIKTYSGKGIDDPYATLRFDVTPLGFHAMIMSPEGRVFIDPYSLGDVENYISYYSRDFQKVASTMDCELVSDESRLNELNYLRESMVLTPTGPQLRTYRLALATTGEYTAFFGGTVTNAMAAVVTSVNRVNGVYETELAIRMILVANNDTLIFTNAATDPYTNNDGFAMLAQNQTTVDDRIGSANYDFGHVFSTGGGGVAYLGVICVDGFKAQGVTGSGSPVGDPFDIDYVAHEMGHQFGGNHSFNGTAGACGGGNRNPSTAYEPGSGSTIMAYAGICGSHNLQSNSDPYFHTVNFDEIVAYTNFGSGNGCAVITNTGNSAPTVSVPSGGFYIPKSTPFMLTGSAADPNNDALTFCWEQFDLGPGGAPGSPSGNAPIFRSWNPTPSGTRFFPRLQNLLNNSTVIGELLPTYTRVLTFRLTARDNKQTGGGVNYAQLQFNVDGNSGPFVVTSPNTNVNLAGGSTQTITWDVANTNIAPVNCDSVNILLSLDGGQTFNLVLSSNTANDGSEDVLLPNTATTTARIKVEAVGNIFFDISNTNFTIEETIPVELTLFNAERLEAGIMLVWETATETNNLGFEIERSIDSESFISLGFISGKGTSTTKSSYSFIDTDIKSGKYYYRLKQIDFDGTAKYFKVVSVDAGLPKSFIVSQNFPNPFNPGTVIKFQLPVESTVRLEIYNSLGERVSELINDQLAAGYHEVSFDGANQPSGILYFVVTASGKDGSDFRSVKKMILMK